MRKVLLVLESEELRFLLGNAFGPEYEIISCSAVDAVSQVSKYRPDILVLDLFLSYSNGFVILQQISDIRPPATLVLTILVTPSILHKAQELRVPLILKPCTIDEMKRRLSAMLAPAVTNTENIRSFLLQLQIPAHLIGYRQLCDAIPMFVRDPNQSLTKELYPAIAKQYGCSAQAVECSIRIAIRKAWEHRDAAAWTRYFPNHTHCPSNKEFIAAIAQWL